MFVFLEYFIPAKLIKKAQRMTRHALSRLISFLSLIRKNNIFTNSSQSDFYVTVLDVKIQKF